MLNLDQYRTLVFDCDGVILNSNHLKIEAYFATAKNFGASDQAAQALVDYHIKLGGISRFVKFEYFLNEILKKPSTQADVDFLLEDFGREVRKRLATCEIAPGLEQLREKTAASNWLVISGGDQEELRAIFAERNLMSLFDGGIFGSPDNKDQIMAREIGHDNIRQRAMFIGDSRYDHESSSRAGLDFVFLYAWTDFPDWQAYCSSHDIKVLPDINTLLTQACN
ncbi:HAD hydrolase-like protein [Methylobacillus arboreus]|uniref:HAD family hydrolase n=1 Tax=Methylobacillus arboreus TaxID=755170 RepID=UPI001E3FCC3A|nr:HAD hydrolase-like protein [Methylobacillus arboreus]MCB5191587.1 HAD hydrolase-like protein [Methylobacillus arboreus]